MNMLKSSTGIEVRVRKRTDGKYAIIISLQTYTSSELFEKFKVDVIESSAKLQSELLGLSFIAHRYSSWQRLFHGVNSGKLSLHEIKGLIGELLFLSKHMFQHYGYLKALNSWTGLDGTDKDFYVDDTWFEIKTTTSGNQIILISSIEQLDSQDVGYLAVATLDQTNVTDTNSLSIGSLIKHISFLLKTEGLDEQFNDMLLRHGYCDFDEYENYHFKIGKLKCFCVDSSFPALKRGDIKHHEIVNAVYQLNIGNIEETVIEGWNE